MNEVDPAFLVAIFRAKLIASSKNGTLVGASGRHWDVLRDEHNPAMFADLAAAMEDFKAMMQALHQRRSSRPESDFPADTDVVPPESESAGAVTPTPVDTTAAMERTKNGETKT